jgi:hypothetical protein
MKLSHILIASLVCSAVSLTAQGTTKPKPASKSKPKTETKTREKTKAEKKDTFGTNKITRDPHYCPACGRG